MPRQRRRITKPVVDGLGPGAVVWDGELPGFGVRCQRKVKSYILKYRARGRQRFLTIGRHGAPWTPEMARREARRLLGEVAAGLDPAAQRDARKAELTLSELAARYLEERSAHRKPKSNAADHGLLNKHLLPMLGRERVSALTRADIARLHHDLRGLPAAANRCIKVLSAMFAWAERHGYRSEGSNPCRHVERYREAKRERFLSATELARLGAVLAEIERRGAMNPYALAAVRLLILTGARRNEVLTARWEHVDFERGCLRLPDSKTGAKVIYLSAPALRVLEALPHLEDNPHIIPGLKPGAHLTSLQQYWEEIRARAGLDDVRLHDLRHSFASIAVAGGLSLPLIGKLLGHSQADTTERYAHLADDPLRAAAEAIGTRIAQSITGESTGEVVPLSRTK